jgi:hypothetical protein
MLDGFVISRSISEAQLPPTHTSHIEAMNANPLLVCNRRSLRQDISVRYYHMLLKYGVLARLLAIFEHGEAEAGWRRRCAVYSYTVIVSNTTIMTPPFGVVCYEKVHAIW